MKPTPTFIFPGLDGSDLLLSRFAELAPDIFDVTVCTLPDAPDQDYASLCDHFSEFIREQDTCHIIAESFSGPLGILLAHRFPSLVGRLTLVATFATSPAPIVAGLIPWSLIYRMPLPSIVAKRYLVGPHRLLVADLKNAIRKASSQTLARRMRCLMEVDVTPELSELKCNIKYIRPKQDRLVPQRSVDTIVNANPEVTIYEIDGPHLILQTRPEQAWDCILDGLC